jgi:hypothetical protein
LAFALSSGTSSGTKYIPVTRPFLREWRRNAVAAVLSYTARTGDINWCLGKRLLYNPYVHSVMIGGLPASNISGLAAAKIPSLLRHNFIPTHKTNMIENWDDRLDAIVHECIQHKVTIIGGLPHWIQMLFDRADRLYPGGAQKVFSGLSIISVGGANPNPYLNGFKSSLGRNVPLLESYGASEGNIAFQDNFDLQGLLLCVDSGIFYEFVPYAELFSDKPTRHTLGSVELGIDYAIILNTNSGLWGYILGDIVCFISLHPYRLVVRGRIREILSRYREDVVTGQAEQVLFDVAHKQGAVLTDFTVAVQPVKELGGPFHEWLIEFRTAPADIQRFAMMLEEGMRRINTNYNDLISAGILHPLHLRFVRTGGFIDYLRSIGKLGGQNKVPRLSNDYTIVNHMKREGLLVEIPAIVSIKER